MPSSAFHTELPNMRTTSVVFASPHSGRDYPWSFVRKTILDEQSIRTSEDAFVDKLFDQVPLYGAPLLTATAPRAFVDLNRNSDELDPALIEGVSSISHNPRVASGLGVIPRVVANGRAIYRGKLPFEEARRRLNDYWKPYHGQLELLLTQSHKLFGEAILIDCHSMPHEAIDSIAKAGARRPDVVLGDRFGAAATSTVVDRIEAALTSAGLHVVRNAPFAGAYITQRYGRPSRRQHVVQIEIDRSLYMNEQMIRPNNNFTAFKATLNHVISDVTDIGRKKSLAAE